MIKFILVALGLILYWKKFPWTRHRSRSMFQRLHVSNTTPTRLQIPKTSRSG
jgi:hypothetical protein